MTILRYRWNYYMGKVWKFFGYCWTCGAPLMFTRHGRGICPSCRKTY